MRRFVFVLLTAASFVQGGDILFLVARGRIDAYWTLLGALLLFQGLGAAYVASAPPHKPLEGE